MKDRISTTVTNYTKPKTCRKCGDTGVRIVEREDGAEAATLCDCQISKPSQYPLCYYWQTDLAAEWGGASLNDFEARSYEYKLAAKWARYYVDNWQRFRSESNGFYFYGSAGNGKTMLTALIGNEIATSYNDSTQIISTSALLRMIRDTFDDAERSEKGIINAACAVSLLILDDIGAEKPTEFAEETLHTIIETRRSRGKPTLYTSNVQPSQLQYHDRTISRISGTVAQLRLPDTDQRRAKRRQQNRKITQQTNQ